MSGRVILDCRGVAVDFGGLRALDSLDLQVIEGEVLAIVGPNGAGKTTLFNVLAGAFKPTEGTIFLDGENITGLRAHERARLGIGRTFQVVRPFAKETVLRNVAVASVSGGRKHRPDAVERAADLLSTVGLGDRIHSLAGELGQGERRRLELARALALEPSVLLLDEVMSGLNPSEVQSVGELLKDIANTTDVNIVLIEHLIRAVRSLADRVIVLDAGVVLAEGTSDEVFRDPSVIEAYLGSKYASS